MVQIDAVNCYLFTSWQIANNLQEDLLRIFNEEIISIEIIHQYPFDGGFITYLDPLFEKE
jgi:hypothetical protein